MDILRRKEIYSNYPYILWFLLYFTLFWFIFGASMKSFYFVGFTYLVSILFALSPMAESLWRSVVGIREVTIKAEKEKLMPLFKAVYQDAIKIDANLPKNIKLYIQDTMDINAFAFGRETLVLTKGSVSQLSDDSLKGLIAHEFGHFSHYDTTVLLIASVGNMLLALFMKLVYVITKILLFIVRNKDSTFSFFFNILYKIIIWVHNAFIFAGDVILMSVSREHEFMADDFANKCGYGEELAEVLNEIHEVSIDNPQAITELLRMSHPPLTQRIERLEKMINAGAKSGNTMKARRKAG